MSVDGLSVRNLRVSFPDADGRQFDAVRIGTLDLAKGVLFALTGASGSGKSTLIAALAGLIRPAEGAIVHGGIDIARLSESARDRWRLRNVGLVFQDFHLIPELSPLGNVTLPASFGRVSFDARSRARSLLDRFGVPASRRTVAVLSRGERQRVAIARALLFDPPILLADEPTASLDDAAAATVADALARLAGEGKLVVVATHDPEIVRRADERVALERGRRVEADDRVAGPPS